ncbi:DNA sulfur modification protein DndB [Streptomyces sp. NPDC054854]
MSSDTFRAPALKPITNGLPIDLMVIRDTLVIGRLDIENLTNLVNDPMEVEEVAARDVKAGREPDDYARMRAEVQRLIGTPRSPKGQNVVSYADYIAAGLKGEYGNAWSIPPVTLWCRRPLTIDPATGASYLPIRNGLIAIDGETQVTALHRIKKYAGTYGLKDFDFEGAMIAFEVYHGISVLEARQIFHDRNLKGAPVDKSLALSMDMRDFATTITQMLVDNTAVTHEGEERPLGDFIITGKRQVNSKAREWMTLSGLRTLVVTTILGKPGIHAASGDVDPDDIKDAEPNAVKRETVEALSAIIRDHAELFHAKTAITAPAVLAGLGATVHRQMSWSKETLPAGQTVRGLLEDVRWEREADYWGGVAAKVNDKGTVSWAGGARDSGHKVYEALNNPASEVGRQIRGLPYQRQNL